MCLVVVPCLASAVSSPSPLPTLRFPYFPHPGLEIDEGNFYWAEPPPKKPEPGKKGGPPGSQPASKPASKAPSRRGSFFKRSKSQQALEGGKAGGAEAAANGEVVAVELPAMKEEHGKGGANGAANGTANGTAPPASPEKPVGDDLSDSAQEGPCSSGPPSPPPEKAAGRGGKEGAWWLRGVNLRVRRGLSEGRVGRVCSPLGWQHGLLRYLHSAQPILSSSSLWPFPRAGEPGRAGVRGGPRGQRQVVARAGGQQHVRVTETAALRLAVPDYFHCYACLRAMPFLHPSKLGIRPASPLQALLGEMERDSGRVAVGGRLAYAAQQAWIINATGEVGSQSSKCAAWQSRVDGVCSSTSSCDRPEFGGHTG